jgi:hypothetical protein
MFASYTKSRLNSLFRHARLCGSQVADVENETEIHDPISKKYLGNEDSFIDPP